MKKVSCASLLFALMVVVVLLAEAEVTEAVTCNAFGLRPCMGAFSSGQKPTPDCCSKLKEQKPCLCGYLKNPNFKQYVNTRNAKAVAAACGVPLPAC